MYKIKKYLKNINIRKIRRYLNNISPQAWAAIIIAIALVGSIWMAYAAIIGIGNILRDDRMKKANEASVRITAIEKVKAECTFIRVNLGIARGSYTSYTYVCDDGVEYTFKE